MSGTQYCHCGSFIYYNYLILLISSKILTIIMVSLGPRPKSPIVMFILEKYDSDPVTVFISILSWFRSSRGQEWVENSNLG